MIREYQESLQELRAEAYNDLIWACRLGVNSSEYGTTDRNDNDEYHGEE